MIYLEVMEKHCTCNRCILCRLRGKTKPNYFKRVSYSQQDAKNTFDNLIDSDFATQHNHAYYCHMCSQHFNRKKALHRHLVVKHSALPRKVKHEEETIARLLKRHNFKFQREKVVHFPREEWKRGYPKKARLDFVISQKNRTVVLEIDENAHRANPYPSGNYSAEKELWRMAMIRRSMGNNIVIIRYNPHEFAMNGRMVDIPIFHRHQKLVEFLSDISKTDIIQHFFYHCETKCGKAHEVVTRAWESEEFHVEPCIV